ncbi:DUF4236 domain-containing protein [Humibacter ginsengisoli]
MGFYVRKSLKAGPFRFNLSKSGVGVSAGVPGFRAGSGPRGNYVNVGAHGVYYRASLGSRPTGARARTGDPRADMPPVLGSEVLMEDVTGATVQDLAPTASDDLVEQLREASSRRPVAIWVALAALVGGARIMPWGFALWALAIPGVWWLALRDRARRSVVVFYDVNDTAAAQFQAVVDASAQLSTAAGKWRITQSGQVRAGYQHKVNAGASSLVRREPVAIGSKAPSELVTNVQVPTWTAGRTTLLFLPDRILVRENRNYVDVAYDELEVSDTTTRFIESTGRILQDTKQVGTTWQYVNKGGGPDRRFANNPVLPIVNYGEVVITTPGGLRWQLQTSRSESASYTASALRFAANT